MAETFRKLHLHQPDTKTNFQAARETLKPLLELRKEMLVDLSTPVIRLINQEQRQLGIWNAFLSGPETAKEEVQPVDTDWSLRIDFQNEGDRADWKNGGDHLGWAPGQVGMPWRKALESQAENKSRVVWYRTKVTLPEIKDTGERIFLRFGSIDSEARIWLNGELIGERGYPHNGNYDSWNEAFELEVTKSIKPGPNELVIRVESENRNAGITGPVHLVFR